MRDYIESYTQILPVEQRARIMNELEKQSDIVQSITVQQYADILNTISSDDRPVASTYAPMDNTLDSSMYNDFISNALLDLNVLYSESDALERAIGSYVQQNQSMLNEVQHYIDELRHKIETLRYNDKTSTSSVVSIEGFKSLDFIVRQTDSNRADFRDRDGSVLGECVINTNLGYARLNETSVDDVIIQDRPSVSLVALTGQPTDGELFPIANAIDRNMNTFWGNIILSDGAIDLPVILRAEEGAALTVRGGAIAVIDIDFTRKQRINNVAFKMFEEYPTRIETILYKTTGAQEENFKHLITDGAQSTNQSVAFNFQPTNVKTLRVVLKQENHKKHEYTIFSQDEKNNQLIKSLIEADAQKSLAGSFNGLSTEEMNKITGVKTFKDNYAEFLSKFNNFKTLLQKEGFNWDDAKIKEYINTGRY